MTISSVFSNRRLSFAHRLALLTGSVIAVCLAVAVFVAEGMLRRAAISGMHERLSRSTGQLATVIQAGVRQGLSRYAAIAADSALLHVLADSGGNAIAKA